MHYALKCSFHHCFQREQKKKRNQNNIVKNNIDMELYKFQNPDPEICSINELQKTSSHFTYFITCYISKLLFYLYAHIVARIMIILGIITIEGRNGQEKEKILLLVCLTVPFLSGL